MHASPPGDLEKSSIRYLAHILDAPDVEIQSKVDTVHEQPSLTAALAAPWECTWTIIVILTDCGPHAYAAITCL
jgi:hypothetical protein